MRQTECMGERVCIYDDDAWKEIDHLLNSNAMNGDVHVKSIIVRFSRPQDAIIIVVIVVVYTHRFIPAIHLEGGGVLN